MKVISRTWLSLPPSSEFHIYPIGDIHLGNAAVDEDLLNKVVEEVRNDENGYWIGMGDYGDFINRSDKRFNPAALASWFTIRDLGDIAEAQANRIKRVLAPIAGQCLGMLSGNHETSIQKHYERDIYSDVVNFIKKEGGFAADEPLAMGYQGYLRLAFYKRADRQDGRRYTISLHHGFGGGGRIGGKANAMETWLWTHDCDIAIFGHVHTHAVVPAGIEYVDAGGHIRTKRRMGCYSGTFMVNKIEGVDGYEVAKGCLPMPYGGCRLDIRPFDTRPIRIQIR